jgi:hypothetical protein
VAQGATYYSVATGNWAAAATWSTTSGGTPGSVGVPATGPVAGDLVNIEGGFTVTVGATAACATLNIASGSTLTVGAFGITVSGTTTLNGTLTHNSATGTKLYSGLVTINSTGNWNNTGNSPINFRGGVTNNSGTFTAGTGVYTFTTNAQAISGTISIPSVTVTTITLTNNGTLTVVTALAGTGGLTNSATGTLNISGLSTTGISVSTLTATAAGNTVNYTGAAQTVKQTTYVNLGLSGTGAKTTAAITVNGVFDVGGAATVVPSAAPTFGAAATVQFSKTAAYTATTTSLPTAFAGTGGLVIAGTGAITPTTVTALKKLTVNLNATFALAAVTIVVTGAVSNAGTITASTGQLNQNAGDGGFTNSGTITFTGAGRIYFSGNMTNTGTMTLGSAEVRLYGATAGSFTCNGFTTTGAFDCRRTAGTVTFNSAITVRSIAFSAAGGTVNLGTGLTHTSNGVVSIASAATLNGGSSTLNINVTGAAFTNAAGTFTPSTGTINYNFAGTQTVLATATYYNLTLSNSGVKTCAATSVTNDFTLAGTATVTHGANLTVGRDLLLNGGTFTTGAFTLGVTRNLALSGGNLTTTGALACIVGGTTTITTGTLTLPVSAGNKTFTGLVTLNGGTMTGASITVVLGAGIANVGGTVTLSGTATMATAGAALSGTNAIATLTATSPGTVTNGGTLTIVAALAGTGTLTNSGTLNIGGTSSITTLANSGTATITGAGAISTALANFTNTGTLNLNGSGTIAGITNNAAGIVNLNSSGTITAFNNATTTSVLNISTSPTVPTITTLTATTAGNTVNYTASGTQTVKVTTYSNLTLSGSSAKTIPAGSTTVNGVLSMEGTATTTVTGTLSYGGSATLQYKGSSAQTTGGEFISPFTGSGGVKINNANGVTLGFASSLGANPLTIGDVVSSSIFNDGGFQLTASGTLNLTSGTFKLGASAAATTFPAFGTRNINAGTTVEYAATATQTIKGITYSNLTVSGSGNNSKTTDADITVNGVLNLASANASATQGCLDMSTYTLNMGAEAAIPASTTGAGDVTGIVKRAHTFDNNIPYSFGNQYTNITFLGFPGGVKPAWINCKIAIGTAPGWRNVALKRVYSFTQDGTGTDRVLINLHYLDSELNTSSQTPYEPDETQLVLWDAHGGTPWTSNEPHGKTNNDATNNYISRSGFTMTYLAPSTTLDNKQLGLSYSNTTKNTWLGADLTDPTKWDVTTNWSAGYVPLTTEDVLIPGSLANYPTLTLDVEVKTIEIASGASFNAGSYNLTLNGSTGAWSNNGTFNGNSGTVIFSRGVISNVVSLSGTGTNNFNNITVNANTYLQPASGIYLKIAGAVSTATGSIIDLKATNNTVEYNGSAQSIANLQGPASDIGYAHLVINSSGTTTLPGTLNVMRDFTLTTGTAAASASSTIDILGNVTLTAGTFTGSSAAISVGGNWTNNGATFIPGTSTVTFNSTSAAQSIDGTATSQTFYNLVTDKSSQTLSVGGSTTSLTVNNLTETSGNVSPPATLTINGNATLTAGTFTAGTTTTINGNWTNTAATFTAGSGTVAFTGSSAQTISGTNTFNNLTVNNATGVTAASNQSVNGELYLQSANVSLIQGTLELGSNTLTMGASATTTGTGDATGIVTRNSFVLNTPYSFGNQFTTISFTLDPLPTSISVKVVLSSAHTWKSDAIHRY